MKLLRAISLLTLAAAAVYASGGESNNEITYYGCPDECSAQRNPFCSQFGNDLPSHFAALSKSLSGYDSYCGHYAIYMMSDGSNVETLGKATIVDSCGSCAKYHLDLSLSAFKEVREKSKGTGKVIWGVYSKSGSRLAGPFYSSVDGSAKKLGMSNDAFISSFDANAKSLASSGSSSRSFNSSSSSNDVKKESSSTRTTTTRTTTVTTTKTTNPEPSNAQPSGANPLGGAKTLPAKILPYGPSMIQETTTINPAATTLGFGATTSAVAPVSAPTQAPATQKVEQVVPENSKEGGDDDGMATIGFLALGGGVLGAAGAGLLFMKKKNPSTYEDIKQKFPEAFTNVKRGLTRRATSIKRAVTKKSPNSNNIEI